MSDFEVPEPILNTPFQEPSRHWFLQHGKPAQLRDGRRPALVFPPRDQKHQWQLGATLKPAKEYTGAYELNLVNLIRERLNDWRAKDYPGVSRITYDLLHYWRREGRSKQLFYAQLEAAETIIFLREARSDFLQGIEVPVEGISEERQAEGYAAFLRYACKMATGSGKTTVMGLICAWSILNKVQNRADGRFSDVVLIVCPNVTIRDRLQELNPELGEASLYRKRDLVPETLMPQLSQGRILITNWHVFEPRQSQVGGERSRVTRTGVKESKVETIKIGDKTTVARGSRYLTLADFETQKTAGMLRIIDENRDEDGSLVSVKVESERYVESETALVQRILGRDAGGKQNILVLNDEAHHAYRIRKEEDEEEEDLFGEKDDAEDFFKEATIWIDGLDKVNKQRGINFCVDLSATPYFLGRVGQDANRPFPWVVSDFGLTEAIEAGLVKIPQLAVRDTTGAPIPGYFNIWKWIVEDKLTSAERGGRKGSPKPEAILKYAHHPIAMLGGLWDELRAAWAKSKDDLRPPVYIIVCKNTRLAKVVHEWLADGTCPKDVGPPKLDELRNAEGRTVTIRVDSKVVGESEELEGAKDEEKRWMRFTLDTVGRYDWPMDRQGRALYPAGFEELAQKLQRPLHPPGRDVRCIVSVGMLTEGWDCNTVTHVIGLRPFMSQLLCEQVVGRALRRADYEPGPDGKLVEEVAKVFGVPFEVIPFKADPKGSSEPRERPHRVHAIPEKEAFKIVFPRVEGYTQAVRNRVTCDVAKAPDLKLDPATLASMVEVQGLSITTEGRLSLNGPSKAEEVTLQAFRAKHTVQELEFDLAAALTKHYATLPKCEAPPHVLFPQLLKIVREYVKTRVRPIPPSDLKDAFLSPYFGWIIEKLTQAIQPDVGAGEIPELPQEEKHRGPGSTAEVDFFTSREVREVVKSHVNFVVADTLRWEQSAAFYIDTNKHVVSFVKNAGLGFAIPYFHNGQPHDYLPDFIIRLDVPGEFFLILETKGYDPLEEEKRAAALRWCAAVNALGKYGHWQYRIAHKTGEVAALIAEALAGAKLT